MIFMSKINVFVLALLLVFSSCSERKAKVVKEEFANGNPKLVHYQIIHKGDTTLKKEVQYYQGGQQKLEGEYYNNQKHGHWVFWYANGNKWSDGYFEKDLRVGKTLVYHENGKLYYKGAYDKGQKSGLWVFFNQEGKQVNKVTFENGMIKSQSGTKQ